MTRTTLGPRGMHGLDVLGASIGLLPGELAKHRVALVGTYDIGAMQQQLNALRNPVSVAQAKALLQGGQLAIDAARSAASQNNLPGGTARDNVFYKLQWHANALASAGADATPYTSADDLKKWVMQAFIEGNAVEAGVEWESTVYYKIWGDMWDDIKNAVAVAVQALAKGAGDVLDTAKWMTYSLIGGAVLLGVGALYAIYKIATGPTGGAIVSGYLGGRRGR